MVRLSKTELICSLKSVNIVKSKGYTPMTEITYWYHPESDSYWLDDGQQNSPGSQDPSDSLSSLGDDGTSVQLAGEYEFVAGIIEQIDNDPTHKLPDGVDAILKGAYQFPAGGLHGCIYYDRHKRFTDGHNVHVSHIVERKPGGIVKTKNSTYLVHMVDPSVTVVANG